MFVVIHQVDGMLEGVSLFEDREAAIAHGQARWREISGDASSMRADPDYDPERHGVARGHVMHWFGDSWDVWVTAPDNDASTPQHPAQGGSRAAGPMFPKEAKE